MKSTITVQITPFKVPGLVEETPQGRHGPVAIPPAMPAGHPVGFTEQYIAPRQFLLSELSGADLSKLCEDFRLGVFKRAGKLAPKITFEQ